MGAELAKELKIRLDSPQQIADKLNSLGATHIGDATYEYIYFNQPEGKVLKLTKHDGKTFKTVIEREGNRFIVKSSDEIADAVALSGQLAKQHGIKRQLVNHRRIFSYGDVELSINDIENVGVVLIIEGENPQLSFVTETLGIQNPEIITDSFDNLGEEKL